MRPASAAFTDIADERTALNAAALEALGVVDGVGGGRFDPGGTLTRAQFCKLAVYIMDAAGEARQYAQRSVFTDVRGTHWAAGCIHLAVNKGMINGVGDGTFRPDRPIKYGEAVTILMRMLGWADKDFSLAWPFGYIAGAEENGLARQMSCGAEDTLTRAEAAQLFVNLLACDTKGGGGYAASVYDNVAGPLLTASSVRDELACFDGGKIVKYAVAGELPEGLSGRTCLLLLDAKGRVRAAIPVEDAYASESMTVASAQYTYLLGADGGRRYVPETALFCSGGKETAYGECWFDVRSGAALTLFFNDKGDCVLIMDRSSAAADSEPVVLTYAPATEANLASLFSLDSAAGCTVRKNGFESTLSALAAGDAVTYDPASNTFFASDFRLVGYFESVWPNYDTPIRATLFGREFTLTERARREAAGIGKSEFVSVLLTDDLRIAAIERAASGRNAPVAFVKKASAGSAEIEFMNGLTVTCAVSNSQVSYIRAAGRLVTVTGTRREGATLEPVELKAPGRALNMASRMLGSAALAPGCRFFDSVAGDCLTPVKAELLPETVAADRVLHAAYDAQGRAVLVILNEVTGECYDYGMLAVGWVSVEGALATDNRAIAVVNAGGTGAMSVYPNAEEDMEDRWGGVATTGLRAVKHIFLTSAECARADFVNDTVAAGGKVFPVAEDVQVYEKASGRWITLTEARTRSNEFTVWYDKAPELGGMVRCVVVR